MILNKITIHQEYRKIPKDFSLEFKNKTTVITGENGTGKSTILDLINQTNKEQYSSNFSNYTLDTTSELKDNIEYLDSVSGLLKTLSYFDDDNMDLQIKCLKSSSGESLLYQLSNLNNKDLNNKLLILDEPERGLSIKQQLTLGKYLKFLEENFENLQIIVVTHGYVILIKQEEVFSMNCHKYIKVEDFFKDEVFN